MLENIVGGCMKLHKYLAKKGISKIGLQRIIEKNGDTLHLGSIYRIVNGERCKENSAHIIQKATNGEVTLWDLLGDDEE